MPVLSVLGAQLEEFRAGLYPRPVLQQGWEEEKAGEQDAGAIARDDEGEGEGQAGEEEDVGKGDMDQEEVATSAAGGGAGDMKEDLGFSGVAEAERSGEEVVCECSRCCMGGWIGVCSRRAGADDAGGIPERIEVVISEPGFVWSSIRGKYISRAEVEQCPQS